MNTSTQMNPEAAEGIFGILMAMGAGFMLVFAIIALLDVMFHKVVG
ncbi:MAG: hypothetical protein ABEH43_02200 [Flavobacteriales bacterium]